MLCTPFVSPRRSRLNVAVLAAVLASGSLAACTSDLPNLPSSDTEPLAARGPRSGILYGASVRVGDGRARTYIVIENGAPIELGVAMNERALMNLPSIPPGHDPHGHVEFILPLHPTNPTPFRFLELGWNPNGHEPLAIYGAPHFDFHFYTISIEERDAIDPADPEWAQKAGNLPAAEYVPQGWVDAGTLLGADPALMAVPRMGLHWADPTTPELNGRPFTTTFLYGSWDGEFIFAEPMLTKAFLESRPTFSAPIGVAQKYVGPGYHPGSYRVYWDAGQREYRVALGDLAMRGS